MFISCIRWTLRFVMVIGHWSVQFDPVLLSITNTKSKARWLALEMQAFSLHMWLDRMHLAQLNMEIWISVTDFSCLTHTTEASTQTTSSCAYNLEKQCCKAFVSFLDIEILRKWGQRNFFGDASIPITYNDILCNNSSLAFTINVELSRQLTKPLLGSRTSTQAGVWGAGVELGWGFLTWLFFLW